MSASSQLIRPFSSGSGLAYDVLNHIFDYLADICESGWNIRVTNRGKIILSANPLFSDIHHLFRFKTQVRARPVNLTIQRWDALHQENGGAGVGDGSYVVSALEHPHRVHTQNRIDENIQMGVTCDNRCYTYTDPETEQNMVAYVEIRKFIWSGPTFHQGCVYDAKGDSKVVSGFSSDVIPGNARIVVNPYGITWGLDYDGDDGEDELEAAEGLIELADGDGEEEIDFDELMAQPPLQMYM
jgi:hypothetical protein